MRKPCGPVESDGEQRNNPRLTVPSSNRTCGFPASVLDFCRNGSRHSNAKLSFAFGESSLPLAAFPSSSYLNLFPVRSVRSTVVTRFSATTDPPIPGCGLPLVMYSHRQPCASAAPHSRASQVPLPIFPCALLSTTPSAPVTLSPFVQSPVSGFTTSGGLTRHPFA